MLILILSVTKTRTGFCIAGMNEYGQWIRPIVGVWDTRFWSRQQLTNNQRFIKPGDIWEVKGYSPQVLPYANHTEDYITTVLEYKRTLNHNEFLEFLERNVEDEEEFNNTVKANGRSLCLISVNQFKFYKEHWENIVKQKIYLEGAFNMDNPLTKSDSYPIKDCKWTGLLSNNYNLPNFEKVFICIGLATPTPYDGVEYPQVIGIHTLPNTPFTESYPD